jgi:hypothetical protein
MPPRAKKTVRPLPQPRSRPWLLLGGLVLVAAAGVAVSVRWLPGVTSRQPPAEYKPRQPLATSGFGLIIPNFPRWNPTASLEEIADLWRQPGARYISACDRFLADHPDAADDQKVDLLLTKAMALNYEGEAARAYQALEEARAVLEHNHTLALEKLYTVVYFQGVTALRRGETDNCILCRGESSCILPISPSAVHTKPEGSRRAIEHFTEYLRQFPDDLGVRWLLNVAHMTLGEYPDRVEPPFLVRLDRYLKPEFDLGKFRDVSDRVGVSRLNQAGGAIMEDFDNDGLLDLVVTCMDPTQPMAFYRNKGDGTFEDRTEAAGLAKQVGGGLYCVQTDYNNDGHMDVFIPRGAWLKWPVRPSLLRNNGNGTFTDVTREAGLLDPVNSICAAWADFDNDGHLDLFVCCENQPNRLYRNRGDGTFENVAGKAGVQGTGRQCKGAAWIDYDNDGYPDLFLNYVTGTAQLFHNNHDGTFTDVTRPMGIDGPQEGFACWAWDYDNDGWLDIFATSYDRSLGDIVKGLLGEPHARQSNRLYRNMNGKGFRDVTKEAGLDMVFATMGCNYGDFDNDGYLDFYLGTGDPDLATLIPNRLFKNVAGRRFAEVTGPSGTGHLQKGHAVACGDWDRDGNVDIFIEMGGAIKGDTFHNTLFQNPGHDNRWLTVKLVGKKTNRAAVGARIKVVTAGARPLTVHRHVSSGSSFGANPLQQTIGLGKADKVSVLEVHWPTSNTTHVFRDVAVNQALEITEFAADYRKLDWKPVPPPR